MLARHAGPGDSFLLVHGLLQLGYRPRIVLRGALRWAPTIDVALHRVPSFFVEPGQGAGAGAGAGAPGDAGQTAAGQARAGATGQARAGSTGQPRVGSAGQGRAGAAGQPRVGSAGQAREGAAGQTGGAGTRAIGELAAGMGPGDALVIFPEGRNFTADRRTHSITKLEELGDHDAAEDARELRHVLRPRSGGTLAALEAAPEADVMFVAHCGLEELSGVVDLWRGLPMDAAIEVKAWRVPAADIPRRREAREAWLAWWWRRIDAWLLSHLGEEAVPDAVVAEVTEVAERRDARVAELAEGGEPLETEASGIAEVPEVPEGHEVAVDAEAHDHGWAVARQLPDGMKPSSENGERNGEGNEGSG